MATIQKITPFFWFDQQAEQAANHYVSIFKNSKIGRVMRQGDSVLVVGFSLNGQNFSAMNGGPQFQINPSISLFVTCETEAETDAVWQQLAEGGSVMMPLNEYDWSKKYGWVKDKFGLTWQVSLGALNKVGNQQFTPTLLFTGPQAGKGEAAVHFYTSLFKDSSIEHIQHYEAGEPGEAGTLKHAQFSLQGQMFMAMDNPMDQAFTFNEAVSLVVHCATQEEVDFFWEKLTADGGAESQCGWLKDKFGVSWQITPEILLRLVSDPDPAVAKRAFTAMLKMRKIEIDKLTQEPEGIGHPITVKTIVNASIEKVWELWTGTRHVEKWNNASDDWHTPKAENDLRPGGHFSYTMAAKDGSFSFDFNGVYDEVTDHRRIAYTIEDGRKVTVDFEAKGDKTEVTETFDAETVNSEEMQRAGWQAILDNFKKYAEGTGG